MGRTPKGKVAPRAKRKRKSKRTITNDEPGRYDRARALGCALWEIPARPILHSFVQCWQNKKINSSSSELLQTSGLQSNPPLKVFNQDQKYLFLFEKLRISVHKNVCKHMKARLQISQPHRLEIPILRVDVRHWQWCSEDVGDLMVVLDRDLLVLDIELVHQCQTWRIRHECRNIILCETSPFVEAAPDFSSSADTALPSMSSCSKKVLVKFNEFPKIWKCSNPFASGVPKWGEAPDFTGAALTTCRDLQINPSSIFTSDEQIHMLIKYMTQFVIK